MTVLEQIENYISSLPEAKKNEMQALHSIILGLMPKCKIWFLDGKNNDGKIVSNPNIGYGAYQIQYKNGTSKEFYQIGLSANQSGISIYLMGIEDKNFLIQNYQKSLVPAKVTSYCIKFKSLKQINQEILKNAINDALGKSSL